MPTDHMPTENAPLPVLDLDDLLIGRRPDGACIACNYTRFIVTNGAPELSAERLERERALFRAAVGDETSWRDDETFDALVHTMRCQRCGHEETVFLPPIDPPIIGPREAVFGLSQPRGDGPEPDPSDWIDEAD